MICFITVSVILLYAAFAFSWLFSSPSSKPKSGIYSQASSPAYPIKFVLFYILVFLKKIQDGRAKKKFTEEELRSQLIAKDSPQPFSGNPQGFDAVFFSGANNKTGEYLIIATERRPQNITYGIFYLLLPDKGLFRGSWLPNTVLPRTEDDDSAKIFEGGNIRIKPVEPMRRWNLKFKGEVEKCSDLKEETEKLEMEVDLDWSSDGLIFTYDTDMSTWAAAKAFAKETWNRQFFDDLKKAHQTHYEQMGHLQGSLSFNGETRKLNLDSFRDHSYGTKRDWKLMHRYIFHHIFLSNGIKAVVGVVCQPHTCSSLECGFVSWSGDGRVSAVECCDLELANHGEGGRPPKNYGFTFCAGGQEFQVQVEVLVESSHFLGLEKETKNIERFVKYNINGVPGVGITEWNYRNI